MIKITKKKIHIINLKSVSSGINNLLSWTKEDKHIERNKSLKVPTFSVYFNNT